MPKRSPTISSYARVLGLRAGAAAPVPRRTYVVRLLPSVHDEQHYRVKITADGRGRRSTEDSRNRFTSAAFAAPDHQQTWRQSCPVATSQLTPISRSGRLHISRTATNA